MEDNTNLDIVIKDGEFNWGRTLTSEEKQRLHSVKRRPVKDRGIGKRSKSSESTPEENSEEISEFCLSGVNFSINKVQFLKKHQLVLK